MGNSAAKEAAKYDNPLTPHYLKIGDPYYKPIEVLTNLYQQTLYKVSIKTLTSCNELKKIK